MSYDPYPAHFRMKAKQIESVLINILPEEKSILQKKQNTLDPFSAYQVLVLKFIGLVPAILACCLLIATIDKFTATLSAIVLVLTLISGVILHAVERMESIAGLWRWRAPGEAHSISRLRFFGQQFYPARLSSDH